MTLQRRFLNAVGLACALVALSPSAVQADPAFPDKPIRIIVPSTAGGGFDVVSRILGQYLGEVLKQNIVIENRTGAGTLVGTQVAAKAAPDGYTLLAGGLSNIVWNMHLYSSPGYDGLADFVPVGLAYTVPYVAVVRKDFPANSLKEMLDLARAQPGKLNMAHLGSGTGAHIMGNYLMKQTGVRFTDVPYKGSQAAYPDLIAGRADVMFDTAPSARPHIQAGNMKALAIVSPRRSSLFPNVPTSAEAGVPGWEIESWVGLFAPAKTPPAVLDKLRSALNQVLSNKELRQKFETTAGEVFTLGQQETEAFIKAEGRKWAAIVRDAGIKPQ
jgi:tripartite-type tricarboxylate transporter receptor subunit TctC